MNKKIRSLKPEEIEIRVQQVTSKGVQLLLYKDSRCDKRILDETFGITGWKDDYKEIHGNLFCTISIWDNENKQWIEKTDCGVESNSEKEKGEASDAFKRAGFNVGIGRELYTRILYFANVPTVVVKDKNGKEKYEMQNKYEKFSVVEISTNENTEKIEKIKIADSKGNIVFSYGYKKNAKETTLIVGDVNSNKPIGEEQITAGQVQLLHIMLDKVEKTKEQLFKTVSNDKVKETYYKKYGVTTSKELTKKQATEMIDTLKKVLGEV